MAPRLVRGATSFGLAVALSAVVWGTVRGDQGGEEAPTGLNGVAVTPAAYGLAAIGAEQNFVPGDRAALPPAGSKWIVVGASLHNLGGDEVVVEPSALALVDLDGRRFGPDTQTPYTQPPLVGTRLGRGEWIVGLVLFEVPQDVVGRWLEWCPAGQADQTGPAQETCDAPLRSRIVLTPS